jgi:sec-independent protein translocase protein TatC
VSAATLPAGEIDEGRMTLMEHLVELRGRVIKSAIAVAVGAVLAWILYPWIFDILLHPYKQIASDPTITGNRSLTGGDLLQTDPLEGFAIRLKIATYGGIAFAMPVILWQIWRFVTPGLYKHEKRYALPFILSAVALFVTGAGIAYWTLPKALSWLIGVGGGNLVTAFTPSKYFQLILYMMLAFGIGFEFPILLIFLQLAGIVSNEWLRKYRRHAIVTVTIVVAVATPSNDPISMLALAVPMCLFYEVAIIVGRVINRRKRKAAAGQATAGA